MRLDFHKVTLTLSPPHLFTNIKNNTMDFMNIVPIENKKLPNSGKAITSLVAGIVSIFGFGMFIIPSILGVIFGHIALADITRKKAAGRGLAIAGLVTSYLSFLWLLVLVTGAIIIPASANKREHLLNSEEINRLKQVGLQTRMLFIEEKHTHIPDNLYELNKLTDSDLSQLTLSTFNDKKTPSHPHNGDIVWLAAGCKWTQVNHSDVVLAYIAYPNKGQYINILFGDGHVETHRGSFDSFCTKRKAQLPNRL